jgi:predicted GH43/DUF377 family glycosyl hydrolase
MLHVLSTYKKMATWVALLMVPLASFCGAYSDDWKIGPFERADANPILAPSIDSVFHCPVQNKEIRWESDHIFNPAAVVRNGQVYLIYRAEDGYGEGVGMHTSRLGLAISDDGVHFRRQAAPVLYPKDDDQQASEFPGGCEDPRIVETEEGSYVMTYTQWDRQVAMLAIATSRDLLHWKKHGYAFKNDPNFQRKWSKSGSIVCRREGDRLVATKIDGKYWMFWGEGTVQVATSDNLISWTRVLDSNGQPVHVIKPRKWRFDSELTEPGPPALITKDGILLLYNGKNAPELGDPHIFAKAYSAGQLLLDPKDPTRVISRSETPFLTPQKHYEMTGQYKGGTVFIQGLVHFNATWFLYYGTADSAIGVATTIGNIEEH